jgi:hypothetical protein
MSLPNKLKLNITNKKDYKASVFSYSNYEIKINSVSKHQYFINYYWDYLISLKKL